MRSNPEGKKGGPGPSFFFNPFSGGIGLGLPESAGDVVQNTLKRLFQNTHAVAPVIAHAKFFSPGTMENHIPRFVRQILIRRGQ